MLILRAGRKGCESECLEGEEMARLYEGVSNKV